MIANTERRLDRLPEDPGTHYTLGRLYGLAYVQQKEPIWTLEPEPSGTREAENGTPPPLPQLSPDLPMLPPEPTEPIPLEAVEHLRRSIAHHRRAVELGSEDLLHRLGLGWALEQGSRYALEMAPPEEAPLLDAIPPAVRERYRARIADLVAADFATRESAGRALATELPDATAVLLEAREHENPEVRARVEAILTERWTGIRRDEALETYRTLYDRTAPRDLATRSFGPGIHGPISREAGEGILRILEMRGKHTPEEIEEKRRIAAAIAALRTKPVWITPILVPLGETMAIEELVDRERRIPFDLDGDGTKELLPWIRPSVGWLVWDPIGTGRVDSGRDLFGTFTWWMFWPNGYAALAALDDNGDGWLAGTELAGIRIWTDADGDAESGPGEVRPVDAHGIVAVATWTDGVAPDGSPMNSRGILLENGRMRPSYDWILEIRN